MRVRRDKGTEGLRHKGRRRRGFSLVEVLLAIFIMGIGVIAVAALFPAGISQQQRSTDDIIGPIAANNALAILRTRLRPEDFGTFEEFGVFPPLPTIEGDWTWRRPGFYFSVKTLSLNDPISGPYSEEVYPGSISIFSHGASQLDADSEIPWNSARFADGPVIIFNQGERSYPMQTQKNHALKPPQYVWDCMFRRYQGKILVAIFVYRVTVPGGSGQVYTVPQAVGANATFPPLPIDLVIDPGGDGYDPNVVTFMGEGMWDAPLPTDPPGRRALILATTNSVANPYNRKDQFQAWQEPRQWILDQSNNVHRTLSRSIADNGSVDVEMVRPVSEMINLQANWLPTRLDMDGNGLFDTDIVTRIWYLPLELDYPGGTYLLTPVYLTVREL